LTPKEITNFRIDTELLEALREIRDRDGVGIAEQVRRAIRVWVESKGVKVKPDRQRASTRKRS
jgi:Ribbon-helix-helix protein, copG family